MLGEMLGEILRRLTGPLSMAQVHFNLQFQISSNSFRWFVSIYVKPFLILDFMYYMRDLRPVTVTFDTVKT